ncbi:hypothetical protein [Oribacterium sp. FC2011]|uniref:hypothetical protein n=1 Tax=Oribacterium sp. FC2011 TaxID=1408311 RepID=UPI0004E1A6BE|nr:hypothetical protein [Oribacterium sp. FC2011]
MNERNNECDYCMLHGETGDLPDKWIFSAKEKIECRNRMILSLNCDGQIDPTEKALHVSVGFDESSAVEIISKDVPINYCPMCGRKL